MCGVFVVRFGAPLSAAYVVCGVVSYTIVTVELTVWRNEVSEDNEQDQQRHGGQGY